MGFPRVSSSPRYLGEKTSDSHVTQTFPAATATRGHIPGTPLWSSSAPQSEQNLCWLLLDRKKKVTFFGGYCASEALEGLGGSECDREGE